MALVFSISCLGSVTAQASDIPKYSIVATSGVSQYSASNSVRVQLVSSDASKGFLTYKNNFPSPPSSTSSPWTFLKGSPNVNSSLSLSGLDPSSTYFTPLFTGSSFTSTSFSLSFQGTFPHPSSSTNGYLYIPGFSVQLGYGLDIVFHVTLPGGFEGNRTDTFHRTSIYSPNSATYSLAYPGGTLKGSFSPSNGFLIPVSSFTPGSSWNLTLTLPSVDPEPSLLSTFVPSFAEQGQFTYVSCKLSSPPVSTTRPYGLQLIFNTDASSFPSLSGLSFPFDYHSYSPTFYSVDTYRIPVDVGPSTPDYEDFFTKLKHFFVPSESEFSSMTSQMSALFSSKFGLFSQASSLVYTTIRDLVDAFSSSEPYSFHFPGIVINISDTSYTIVEEQDVSTDNELFSTLQPLCGSIVLIVCVLGILNVLRRYWQILIGDDFSMEIHHWDD